jgi:hypothetical protein
MEIFVCGCCSEPFPTIHRHVHHKTPQALGGKDTPDNMIELCPGCHDTLHNVAYKLLNKHYSTASVLDSVRLVYKENTKAVEICTDLAIRVRDAMIRQREQGAHPDQLMQLNIRLRKRHKDLLSLRASALHLSQEDYLRMLIFRDLKVAFNAEHLDPVAESSLIRRLKRSR